MLSKHMRIVIVSAIVCSASACSHLPEAMQPGSSMLGNMFAMDSCSVASDANMDKMLDHAQAMVDTSVAQILPQPVSTSAAMSAPAAMQCPPSVLEVVVVDPVAPIEVALPVVELPLQSVDMPMATMAVPEMPQGAPMPEMMIDPPMMQPEMVAQPMEPSSDDEDEVFDPVGVGAQLALQQVNGFFKDLGANEPGTPDAPKKSFDDLVSMFKKDVGPLPPPDSCPAGLVGIAFGQDCEEHEICVRYGDVRCRLL